MALKNALESTSVASASAVPTADDARRKSDGSRSDAPIVSKSPAMSGWVSPDSEAELRSAPYVLTRAAMASSDPCLMGREASERKFDSVDSVLAKCGISSGMGDDEPQACVTAATVASRVASESSLAKSGGRSVPAGGGGTQARSWPTVAITDFFTSV